MNFRGLHCKRLNIPSWSTAPGQTWCVLGGNASGKSLLAALIAGEAEPDSGEIIGRPVNVSWISFETQQATFEEELRNDDTDFLDRIDPGTTGLAMILSKGGSEQRARELASLFRIEHILARGYRLLSSGEARKVLLLREILAEPDLLILDEPFEGLDAASSDDLNRACHELAATGHELMLLANRLDDVADWASHLAVLSQGQLVCAGERTQILDTPEVRHLMEFDRSAMPPLPPPPGETARFDPLLQLRSGRIQYSDIVQFEGLDWTLRPGEHTLITGPNGAGKSTLLQLVCGDHPQCYSNDLTIFGYKRGSGESIWDIKKHIGIVSASLHRDYRAPGNALTAVISGLYDSIGLYREPTAADLKLASHWLELIGLRSQANAYFRELSYGQQRLVLIARGLIKQPPLLILDEPTQGLDDLNRHLVLAFLETLAALEHTTLLFVSHRQDEHLSLFKNRIHFEPSDKDGVRFRATPSDS